MSTRTTQIKHLEETMSVRDFSREDRFGRGVSPYKHSDQLSVEFSFKQMDQSGGESSSYLYKSESIMSLKHNLQHLPKSQIIELLLEQINSSHSNPSQRQKLNDTLQNLGKFNNNNQNTNYKQQYDQLVKGFQQYITNTRQAQQHYIKIIDDLKKQLSKKTNQTNKHLQIHSPHGQNKLSPSSIVIEKLEQTIQNYIQINNQLIGKVQKLQRLNIDLSQQRSQASDRLQVYKQQNQFLHKQNQKLKKQNISFKSIIDELKDYIIQHRQEAKDNNQSQVSETSRTNKSSVGGDQINELYNNKKQFIMIEKYDDSIIQSSEIKKREHTFNESTIVLDKDSHGVASGMENNKQSQERYYKHHQQDEYDESMHTSHLISTQTLMIMQNQNHDLKLTNEKLQRMLQKKTERINLLQQENQALKNEMNMVNDEIAQLRARGKRNQAIHDQSITTASRCTTYDDMRKNSNMGTPKQQFYTNKNKKPQWQTSNQGFIKRSHCTETGFKTQQHIHHIDLQQQNKSDQNKFRKSFNLDEFNFLKGQSEIRSPYHEKKTQRGSEQYYVAQTLNVSNKKF